MKKLLSSFKKDILELKNHIVMAPMTRSRAIGNQPNGLMSEYYGQRSGAGLIITEGTAPAPEALGYARIPGIFTKEQIQGWKLITEKVHQNGSKIFLQLMHTGRIGHVANLPENLQLVGPSNITAAGQIHTDSLGMQDHSQPTALSAEGIQSVIKDFVTASKNAVEAGFDGVELHAANGYLLEQFLNPNVNNRLDQYGGSIENRSRFSIEIASNIAHAIGKEKVGIRFSPFSPLGDLAPYDEKEVQQTYAHLSEKLNEIGIAYLHIAVNGQIPEETFKTIRANFTGVIILCNGLTAESGEAALNAGFADLVAFGRAFLANPDYVQRIEQEAPFNEVDFTTLYTADAKGYIDYPTMAQVQQMSDNQK
jgi:N-ethylmaleimide reductase